MKTSFLFLVLFALLSIPLAEARACGGNTPEELAKRSKAVFDRWDTDRNGLLDVPEFLGSDGRALMVGLPPDSVVAFYKDKVREIEEYKNADTDGSGGLSHVEWQKIQPDMGFMRKGCGD